MNTSKSPKVIAVMLNWNGKVNTIKCLFYLTKLNYTNLEIIVVDNNSQDDSIAEIKFRFPNVEVIRNNKNLGYAKGFNSGIKSAMRKPFSVSV